MTTPRPRGPTIDLAVIRWPAKNRATRIGSVFVNPGGPGGSGLEFLRTAPPGALDAFARLDVVSWDPRGIGESRPAVDCLTDDEQNAGRHGFGISQHFWWVSGYGDIPYAVYPVPQKGTYRGPFTNPSRPHRPW